MLCNCILSGKLFYNSLYLFWIIYAWMVFHLLQCCHYRVLHALSKSSFKIVVAPLRLCGPAVPSPFTTTVHYAWKTCHVINAYMQRALITLHICSKHGVLVSSRCRLIWLKRKSVPLNGEFTRNHRGTPIWWGFVITSACPSLVNVTGAK